MPCGAVQQLPHVRRGACDWTVGSEGAEMHWFHSVTLVGSVFCVRNKLYIIWKSCKLFFENQLEQIFQILH